jgi:formylglycine-generating enzyme required for sulfatase activity
MKKIFIILFLLTATLSFGQNRYALVIGNAQYPRVENRLPNAINDTNDIGAALGRLGYNVTLRQNLQHRDMVREVGAFITQLKNNRNSEGFFWYAGHAIEIEGENFLMPLDVSTESDILAKSTSYSVTELTRQLDSVNNKVNVLVLDACRVPPQIGGERSRGDTTRVIREVQHIPPDLFVIYSTASGTVAFDGDGRRNSPFTEAFLKHITSTEPLTLMVGHVTTETLSLTRQRQRPYYNGSMGSQNIYYSLNPNGQRPPPPPVPSPEMVRINGGTFMMGSPANEPERVGDEGPQHRVTVSSFYMGKYEITQKEYQEVIGTNPSRFKGENLPVDSVSWYDAVEYCNALSRREGLTPAYAIDKSRSDPNNTGDNDNVKWVVTWNRNANGYRLPTEAEWEYACRAGTTTRFSTGNNITTIQANYHEAYQGTIPVGSFAPNPWGLYDMYGNVSEWCWDWYGSYSSGTQTDPVGVSSGFLRILRGGDWISSVSSAMRGNCHPNGADWNFNSGNGFRIVRN